MLYIMSDLPRMHVLTWCLEDLLVHFVLKMWALMYNDTTKRLLPTYYELYSILPNRIILFIIIHKTKETEWKLWILLSNNQTKHKLMGVIQWLKVRAPQFKFRIGEKKIKIFTISTTTSKNIFQQNRTVGTIIGCQDLEQN